MRNFDKIEGIYYKRIKEIIPKKGDCLMSDSKRIKLRRKRKKTKK